MVPIVKPEGLFEKILLKIKGEVALKERREKQLQANLDILKIIADKIVEKGITWVNLVEDLEIISNYKLAQSEKDGTLLSKTGYVLTTPESLCVEMNAKYLKEKLGFEKLPTKHGVIFEENGEVYLDISKQMPESHEIPEGANKLTPLGSGTERDPYQIWFIDQLLYIDKDSTNGKGNTRSAFFKLMRSLDFHLDHHYIIIDNKKDWTEGKGWYPLGNPPVKSTYLATHESAKVSFSGYFDGNHKEIRNLYINRPDASYQALFGQTNGAKIKNLSLKYSSIVGQGYVGSIVGQSGYSKIKRCFVIGTVQGAYATGGIAGYSQNKSIIDKCFFIGSVMGDFYTGGAIGISHTSEAKRTFAEAEVNGIQTTGGFVGQSYGSKISDCYAKSTIRAKEKTSGGFAGEINEASDIHQCHASGDIYGEVKVGEFAGDVYANSKIDKCVTASNILEGEITKTENFTGRLVQSEVSDSGKISDMKDSEKFFKWDSMTWSKSETELPTLNWVTKLF